VSGSEKELESEKRALYDLVSHS